MNNKFMHKIKKPQRYTEEHLKGKKKSYIESQHTQQRNKKSFSLPGWSFRGALGILSGQFPSLFRLLSVLGNKHSFKTTGLY